MFIGRRQDGTIYGCWANRQPDDEHHPNQEEVPDDHPEVVAYKTTPRIPAIKQRAREVILSRYPDWKQQNMTAHAVELLKKFATGTITPEERAAMDRYETEVWAWIRAVRAASDAAERDELTADQVVWP